MFAFECGAPSREAKLSSPKAGQPRVASRYKGAARSSCSRIPGSTAVCCHSELWCLSRDGLVAVSTAHRFQIRALGLGKLPYALCAYSKVKIPVPWERRNGEHACTLSSKFQKPLLLRRSHELYFKPGLQRSSLWTASVTVLFPCP